MMKVSNTTIKYAKQQIYSKIVDRAVYLLRKESLSVIYGEFIDDSDNKELKECLLFILSKENHDLKK